MSLSTEENNPKFFKNPIFKKLYCYIPAKKFNIMLSILWNGKTEPPNLQKFFEGLIDKFIDENRDKIQPPRRLNSNEIQ